MDQLTASRFLSIYYGGSPQEFSDCLDKAISNASPLILSAEITSTGAAEKLCKDLKYDESNPRVWNLILNARLGEVISNIELRNDKLDNEKILTNALMHGYPNIDTPGLAVFAKRLSRAITFPEIQNAILQAEARMSMYDNFLLVQAVKDKNYDGIKYLLEFDDVRAQIRMAMVAALTVGGSETVKMLAAASVFPIDFGALYFEMKDQAPVGDGENLYISFSPEDVEALAQGNTILNRDDYYKILRDEDGLINDELSVNAAKKMFDALSSIREDDAANTEVELQKGSERRQREDRFIVRLFSFTFPGLVAHAMIKFGFVDRRDVESLLLSLVREHPSEAVEVVVSDSFDDLMKIVGKPFKLHDLVQLMRGDRYLIPGYGLPEANVADFVAGIEFNYELISDDAITIEPEKMYDLYGGHTLISGDFGVTYVSDNGLYEDGQVKTLYSIESTLRSLDTFLPDVDRTRPYTGEFVLRDVNPGSKRSIKYHTPLRIVLEQLRDGENPDSLLMKVENGEPTYVHILRYWEYKVTSGNTELEKNERFAVADWSGTPEAEVAIPPNPLRDESSSSERSEHWMTPEDRRVRFVKGNPPEPLPSLSSSTSERSAERSSESSERSEHWMTPEDRRVRFVKGNPPEPLPSLSSSTSESRSAERSSESSSDGLVRKVRFKKSPTIHQLSTPSSSSRSPIGSIKRSGAIRDSIHSDSSSSSSSSGTSSSSSSGTSSSSSRGTSSSSSSSSSSNVRSSEESDASLLTEEAASTSSGVRGFSQSSFVEEASRPRNRKSVAAQFEHAYEDHLKDVARQEAERVLSEEDDFAAVFERDLAEAQIAAELENAESLEIIPEEDEESSSSGIAAPPRVSPPKAPTPAVRPSPSSSSRSSSSPSTRSRSSPSTRSRSSKSSEGIGVGVLNWFQKLTK